MSTGFIAYGRRKTPILPPTMDFPAGTKRDDAVAAFEAAYPGWTMDHAESLVATRDVDGTVEADFAEGDFCDACGAFIPEGEQCGADVDDNPICAACVALYRAGIAAVNDVSPPPPIAPHDIPALKAANPGLDSVEWAPIDCAALGDWSARGGGHAGRGDTPADAVDAWRRNHRITLVRQIGEGAFDAEFTVVDDINAAPAEGQSDAIRVWFNKENAPGRASVTTIGPITVKEGE